MPEDGYLEELLVVQSAVLAVLLLHLGDEQHLVGHEVAERLLLRHRGVLREAEDLEMVGRRRGVHDEGLKRNSISMIVSNSPLIPTLRRVLMS